MLAAVAVLVLPSAIPGDTVVWFFPTQWIVQAAHLTDFGGGGIDYVLSYQSGDARRGPAAFVAIGLLLVATAVLGAIGVVLLRRQRAGAAWKVPGVPRRRT